MAKYSLQYYSTRTGSIGNRTAAAAYVYDRYMHFGICLQGSRSVHCHSDFLTMTNVIAGGVMLGSFGSDEMVQISWY